MDQNSTQLDRWTEIAKHCFMTVSSSALGLEPAPQDEAQRPDHGVCGSVLSLSSEQNTTCVGLSSTADGCRRLAGAMLGMDAAELESLSPEDVQDSIGELVNILAGALKTALAAEDGALSLGLPLFIEGAWGPIRRTQGRHVEFSVGEVPCVLSLLVGTHHPRAA